jgi:hypothetical protein
VLSLKGAGVSGPAGQRGAKERGFDFSVSAQGTTMHLRAASEASRQAWITAAASASRVASGKLARETAPL